MVNNEEKKEGKIKDKDNDENIDSDSEEKDIQQR